MIAWLGMTPHSPESERKRLAILAGFAFLTGRRAQLQLTWRLVVALLLTPFDAPLRSGPGPHSGLCHCCQSQVSDAGSKGREQSGAACDCSCLLSIIVTAFMGTSVIFICFTLSALYAKRRSYLFLGGEGQRVGGRSARLDIIMLSHCSVQVPWCLPSRCCSSCPSSTSSWAPLCSSRYRSAYDVTPVCKEMWRDTRVLPGQHVRGAAHHVRLRPLWHSAHHRKSWERGQGLRVVSETPALVGLIEVCGGRQESTHNSCWTMGGPHHCHGDVAASSHLVEGRSRSRDSCV